MMETLVEQARRLSAGTLSTLTGERRYDTIDAIRADFVAFCACVRPSATHRWQDAWAWFWGTR